MKERKKDETTNKVREREKKERERAGKGEKNR